jgi:hypothetical protein
MPWKEYAEPFRQCAAAAAAAVGLQVAAEVADFASQMSHKVGVESWVYESSPVAGSLRHHP